VNIFNLNDDPKICAQEHCDKHAVKMNVEYPQLLSTAHRVLDGHEYIGKTANGRNIKRWRLDEYDDEIYLACHVNHPSAIWCRESQANYIWLYQLWAELSAEYTHRYGKVHTCWQKLGGILAFPPKNIPVGTGMQDRTQPPPAMKLYPQCIVPGDSIQSYKNYYIEAKAHFAKWTNRKTPEWFSNARIQLQSSEGG
jgi:hypothetical protein